MANLIGIAEGGNPPSAPTTRPVEVAVADKTIAAQKQMPGHEEGKEVTKREATEKTCPPYPSHFSRARGDHYDGRDGRGSVGTGRKCGRRGGSARCSR